MTGLTQTLARRKAERDRRHDLNRKVLVAHQTAKDKGLDVSDALDLTAALTGLNVRLWSDPSLASVPNPRAQLDFDTCDALLALPLSGRARYFVERMAHWLATVSRPAWNPTATLAPLDPFARTH